MRRGRRLPLVQREPAYASDHPLAAGRAAAAALKADARAAILQAGVSLPSLPNQPSGSAATRLVAIGRSLEAARPAERTGRPVPKLTAPTCRVSFDANCKTTEVYATAEIDRSPRQLAQVVDPRAWGLGAGVIDVAFRVERDANGQYDPLLEPRSCHLGKSWPRGGCLFEYARSDIASFENILDIERFEATDDHIVVEYRLRECLRTTFGFVSADGGLQRNDGWIEVEPMRGGSRIQVYKCIRVRDLTPNDPGNRLDFGQWMNQTIGAALSVWVDDTTMMSPVF